MCISKLPKKLFGVALDPADDPWTLELKQAWMSADPSGLDWLSACLDPYDAVTGRLGELLQKHRIEPAGKFPIPSWLWPKPHPSDLPAVTMPNMESFFDSGAMLDIVKQLQEFVREKVFPEIPVMVGVDHSATAGVIAALSEEYGADDIGVVVLDQHFDAIPLSVRLAGVDESGTPVGFSDQFGCGNFWAYLINDGTVRPENLLFIGVADYPGEPGDPRREAYRRTYLDYEERGCRFFTRERFEGDYHDDLSRFLRENIKVPRVYISFDLDVGSYASTYAARYMDRPGLDVEQVLDVAGSIAGDCQRGNYAVAGLDVMEFNMHFLGIETPDGVKDSTLDLAGRFIAALT
ncbi:MAG TPA: arginase family protein [Dehalococcoidales bacterium]|nr:arginase family protein [Dehalococcoidales bacterium]